MSSRIHPWIASLLLLTAVSVAQEPKSSATRTDPPRTPLWNGRAPVGDGQFQDEQAWITVHRPAKSNGAAIVICPGGGYGTLVVGAEGHGIAAWLNKYGITGVVLEYRLPAGRTQVPLLDAQAQSALFGRMRPNGDWINRGSA